MSTRSRKLAAIGSISIAALLLAGCSNNATELSSESPTESMSTPATPAPTTASPGTPTSTASTPPASSPAPSSTPAPSSSTATSKAGIPTDAVGYADELVRDWGAGREAQMNELATGDVIAALKQHSPQGGPNWDRTAQDAGAGSVFVTYTNTKDNSVLQLRVQNVTAANGEKHAVVEAKFTE